MKQVEIDRAWAIAIFDIDGVVRDVSHSYRRALADTVEKYTNGAYRPTQVDIDGLKAEGSWNNDWEASQEMIYRFFEAQGKQRGREGIAIAYPELVAFFQSRYRGADLNNPDQWTGYITQEPLLMQAPYLVQLTQAGIGWGFFSGATIGSANYVLQRRLGLQTPVLVAMEDAPGKPDPTGLFETVRRLGKADLDCPVFYAGDTVADMYTVQNARQLKPEGNWIAIGIVPLHAQQSVQQTQQYAEQLKQAGAAIALNHVHELTPERMRELIAINKIC